MSKKVEAKPKFLVLGIVIGVLAVIALVIFFQVSDRKQKPGKYDQFAQCLTDKGVKMYGAYWCPHCQNQKKEFGSSWHLVKYFECSLPNGTGQTQVCKDAGIQGYPTWLLGDNQKLEGEVSFQELSQKSGCALPN